MRAVALKKAVYNRPPTASNVALQHLLAFKNYVLEWLLD
jgi:hypothetical protein